MHRIALLMLGVWLGSTGAAAAQSLPEGIFASSKAGCAKLQTKAAAELGEDFDFSMLSKTGVTGYLQRCDFISVTARNATSWLATAFCEDAGYAYPDLFAIVQKAGGDLSVTRMTTQQDSYEGADDASGLADDLDPSEVDETAEADDSPAPDSPAPDQGAATGTETATDGFNAYVRCETVKQ